MKRAMRRMTDCRWTGLVVLLAWCALDVSASWGAFAVKLEGQDYGNTNWVGGPLDDWAELDEVPCRVYFTGGPVTGRVITIDFDHQKGGIPAIRDLVNFTAGANVAITAGPTLAAPPASAIWTYTFTVDVDDANPGEVLFAAKISAGAHGVPGGSMSLGGTPSLGTMGIKAPLGVAGTPDLSLVKTGPALAGTNQVITYAVRWNLAKPGDDATGVQIIDALPSVVSFVSGSPGLTVVGNSVILDLDNLAAGAKGKLSYSVLVTNTAVSGSTFQNNALITSAQTDLNAANNVSFAVTTVTNGCIPPSIAADPDTTTNCVGASASLEVIANGTGLLTYQWQKDGGVIAGATNSTLTLDPVGLADDGSYTVVVSNDCGAVTSAAAVLTVVPPLASTISGPTNVCPSATGLVYTNTAAATLPLYAWTITGDATIAGPTNGPAVSVDAGASGSFTVQCQLTDETTGCSDVGSLVVAISAAPAADDDGYSTDEDTPLNVAAPGVLDNDSDADADALTAVIVSTTTHGTLALNADGSFSYSPTANYNGADSFTYQADDGCSTSAVATVTITVNSINDAPTVADSTPSVDEDGTLNVAAPGALAGASDADGDPLTAILVSDVTHGTLTFNADGSYDYTPAANYNGSDSFTFAATDGTFTSAVATVTITVNSVNDAPTVADSTPSVDEDGTLNVAAPGALAGASDADGDPLTAILVTDVTHGMLTFNPDGSYDYAPAANYNGSDSFTFAATDGTFTSAVATVTITVNSVNDAPTVADSTPNVDEDGTLNVAAPGALAGASDADGDPLTAILVTDVTHGMLTFNPDGSYDYTPPANYNGSDSFTFAATDGAFTSAVATVTITVNSLPDAPVANDDTTMVPENSGATSVDVLANDTDADSDPLAVSGVTQPSHGTAAVAAGGGAVTYTPETDYHGDDSFTYDVTDGQGGSASATVNVTVSQVNNPPVAGADNYPATKDEILNVAAPGVLANDTDADGDPLTAVLVDGPANGLVTLNSDGSFSYQPDDGYVGPDSFTYQAGDGFDVSGTTTVSLAVAEMQGADDADLYAKAASFQVNWKAQAQGASADKLKITGKLNPRGCVDDLSGATLAVLVNGTAIIPPLPLDASGAYRSPAGDPVRASCRLSSSKGTYKISLTGVDLRTALGLDNETAAGSAVVPVTLIITGASLDIDTVSADLETLYRGVQDKKASLKYSFKKNATLTGVFNANKTRAKLGKSGGYAIALSGVIESEGGGAITPTGPIEVHVGNDVFTPANTKTLALTSTGKSLKLKTGELMATGLPTAGGDDSYRLPLQLLVPTAAGTNRFESVIELKRPDPAKTKWAR